MTAKQLVGLSAAGLLSGANTMSEIMNTGDSAENILALIHAQPSTICDITEIHAQQKTTSLFLAISDSCRNRLSQTMRRSLFETIDVCLHTLVSYREPGAGTVYDCSTELTQNRLGRFHRNVSEFFPDRISYWKETTQTTRAIWTTNLNASTKNIMSLLWLVRFPLKSSKAASP
jgi:hypothetical protein